MWSARSLRAHLDRELVRALPGGRPARILDLSCGCDQAIAGLREHHPEWSWESHAPTARQETASSPRSSDFTPLPFGSNSFDAAIACATVAACDQPAPLLAELFRVLKPGGIALVNVPAHRWLATGNDSARQVRRRFTAPVLKTELAAAGFRGIQTTHWNCLAAPALWLRLRLAGSPASPQAPASPVSYAELPLRALMAAEHGWILLGGRLPFGESLFAVARKPFASDFA